MSEQEDATMYLFAIQDLKNYGELNKIYPVEDKYGKPANVFGHSLGGSLAEKSDANGKILTYNTGAGILDIGRSIPKNQTDYRNKNDVVSLLSLTQNHDKGKLKEHDTGNEPFDILGNHRLE